MLYPIIKNGTPVAQLPVTGDVYINRELMGPDEIPVSVEMPGVLLSPIGSHITHRSKDYTINTIPNVTKLSNYKYQYGAVFESDLYRLYDKKFKHPTTKNKTFQEYGAPADYAALIVANINSIDSGWSVGACDVLPEKAITFTNQSCRTVLDVIAEAFEMEWSVEGKVIRFVKQVGNVTTLEFSYGRGLGLYSLTRSYQEDKNIVTRAFGYGSTRNLPEGYRNGATQLMFDGEYLERNVFVNDDPLLPELYGVKEGDYENLNIYPNVDGLVSAATAWVDGDKTFTITDAALDFDLNIYFSTLDPKLSFTSGELQGQEFTIRKYDNGTKTITLEVFQDGNGNTLPRTGIGASIGDTYNLFNMHLPDERVQDAEDRLESAVQAWLEENCVPRVLYSLEMDPIYARDNGIYLNPGDKIRVIDVDLGIDELIRVTKTSYPLLFPDVLPVGMKIVCEIANFIPYTLRERLISQTIDNKTEIRIVDRVNSERARANTIRFNNLATRIFDPDGNLAKGTETLYAGMAKIGFDSQNFQLIDVTFLSNAGGDPNALNISSGHLVHNFYEIEGLGYDWVITGSSWSGLDPVKFYYVYAKCSKTALTGTWEISETPVSVNDIPGYYVFNVGQLAEVNIKGYRAKVDFTKGVTYIIGGQIITGDIQSVDGLTGFNLDTGTIYGNITFIASDGSTQFVKNVADAVTDANEYIDAILPDQLQALQDQIDGTIESFFGLVDPTTANFPAADWTTLTDWQRHANDTYTNTATGASWRWVLAGGMWDWVIIADTATQQALVLAGQALDTADGKRRVFIVTPFTPYDAGDLWTDGTDIFRCTVSRAVGSFNPADWGMASIYDSTQVTIDNGIVTAGTVQLGNTGGVNAGITGNGTSSTSIRLWAGDTYANRAIAPFRVQQNGKGFATDLEVKNGCKVGNFNIDGDGLINDNAEAFVAVKLVDGSNSIGASIGSGVPNTFWGASAPVAGTFINTIPSDTQNNVAAVFEAANGVNNFAVAVKAGALIVQEDAYTAVQEGGIVYVGQSITLDVATGGGDFWRLTWVKGWLVSAINLGD